MRTPSSRPMRASRSCSRMSGEVSTSTRVSPAPEIRLTRMEQRRRRFLGLVGSQTPQLPASSGPPRRGTPPEEPQPNIRTCNVSGIGGPFHLGEEAEEIVGGDAREFLFAHAFHFGQHFGRVHDKGGFVGL